jgi:osmotically-inducible protein OsmY
MSGIDRRTLLLSSLAFALMAKVGDAAAQSLGQYVDDAIITTKLKAQISNDFGANQIDVETKNGVVRLYGVAESRRAAIHAEQLAWSIQGVRAVQNELLRD